MTERIDLKTTPVAKATFTLIQFTGMPLWTRIKLGLSVLLTPLTIVLMGRSIRVTYRPKDESLMPPFTGKMT